MPERTSSAIQRRSFVTKLIAKTVGQAICVVLAAWLLLAFRSCRRLRRYNAMLSVIWETRKLTKTSSLGAAGAPRQLALVDGNEGHSQDGVANAQEPTEGAFALAGDSLQFAAAGRAVLLQLAHPFIAQAMEDHSYLLKDPARASSLRFFRIFGIMYPIWFGASEDRQKYLRKFHAMHRNIKGVLRGSEVVGPFQPGTVYSARDVRAMWWVNATLIESGIAAHMITGFHKLDAAALEDYWSTWGRPSTIKLGIPAESVPHTWAGFLEDYIAMWQEELGVGASARGIVDALRRSGDSQSIFRAVSTRGQLSLSHAWLPAPVSALFPTRSALTMFIDALTLHLELGLYVLVRMVLPAKLYELTPYVDAKARKGSTKSVWHSIAAVFALRIVYSTLGAPQGLNPDWS